MSQSLINQGNILTNRLRFNYSVNTDIMSQSLINQGNILTWRR